MRSSWRSGDQAFSQRGDRSLFVEASASSLESGRRTNRIDLALAWRVDHQIASQITLLDALSETLARRTRSSSAAPAPAPACRRHGFYFGGR